MLSELTASDYFYSLSDCRDLLFQVQEHRFTLLQVRQALAELHLRFIGFELPTQETSRRYREHFPGDPNMVDLDAWHRFEELYPQTFVAACMCFGVKRCEGTLT